MSRWFPFLLPLLLLAAPAGAARTDGARDLDLLFHSSVQGALTDCGCPQKPLGGLARRAALIQKVRAEDPDCILVDGGSLFGPADAAGRARSELLAELSPRLGYDAMGVGAWDFHPGRDLLRDSAASLHRTSANLVDAGHGGLLFPSHVTVARKGLRLAFVSILDPSLPLRSLAGPVEGVEVEAPRTALTRLLPELREDHDLVVLLAHMPPDDLRTLLLDLEEVPGAAVDVAILSHGGRKSHQPSRVGGTWVLAANGRGKVLGQARLVLDPLGGLERVESRLHEIHPDLPEDAEMAARVQSFTEAQAEVAAAP